MFLFTTTGEIKPDKSNSSFKLRAVSASKGKTSRVLAWGPQKPQDPQTTAYFAYWAETDLDNVKDRELTADVKLFPPLISEYLSKNDNRVVGGDVAKPHQFPFQAGLVLEKADGRIGLCGGSLVSQNFVLTAAHCLDGILMTQVILGAHEIRILEVSQTRMNSSEFIVHKGWNREWLQNDIALVKLPEAVSLSKYIQLIGLPELSDQRSFTGTKVSISGWGRYSDNTTMVSSVLRYVNSTIISTPRCMVSYPMMIRSPNSYICISGRDKKSSCNGDSGGPLFIPVEEKTNKPMQIGIVSFGKSEGCEKGSPAAFTRITTYLKWIQDNSDVQLTKKS